MQRIEKGEQGAGACTVAIFSCFSLGHTTLWTYTRVSVFCSYSIGQSQAAVSRVDSTKLCQVSFKPMSIRLSIIQAQCSDIVEISKSLFDAAAEQRLSVLLVSHAFFPPLQAFSLSSMTGASTHQHVLLKGLNTAGFPPFESQIMPLQAASVIVAL